MGGILGVLDRDVEVPVVAIRLLVSICVCHGLESWGFPHLGLRDPVSDLYLELLVADDLDVLQGFEVLPQSLCAHINQAHPAVRLR